MGLQLTSILTGNFNNNRNNHTSISSLNTILRDGRPLQLDFTAYTVISNFLILTISLLLTRLFLLISTICFSLLPGSNTSWSTDQVRTIIRNVRTVPDALLNTRTVAPWRYSRDIRAILVVVLWKLASVVIVGVTIVSPVLLARTPTVLGRLGSKDDCIGWYTPGWLNLGSQSQVFPIYGELASAALSDADKQYDLDGLNATSIRLAEHESVSISNKCPEYADKTACDDENGLFVGTQLWLSPADLGVGGTDDVRVGLGTSCYKAKQLVNVVETYEDGNRSYGYMFGRYVGNNYTAALSTYGYLTGNGNGYSWFSATRPARLPSADGLPPWAQYPPFFNSTISPFFWQPNSTIKHHGDLTFLLFNGAGPYSPPTTDPLYETNPLPSRFFTSVIPELWHQSLHVGVPVICNTSYTICTNEKCEDVEGIAGYTDYVNSNTANLTSSTRGFLQTLKFDGLSQLATIASFPGSVRGSRTLYANVQTSIQTLTGRSELLRLQLASKMWLLGSARRAASPNRLFNTSKADLLEYYTTTEQGVMCSHTLLPDTGKLVIPGNRLIILAAVLVGVVALSYFVEVLERVPMVWKLCGGFIVRWRCYGFAQLHRIVCEKVGDVHWTGGVDEYPVGPDGGEGAVVKIIKVGGRDTIYGGGNGMGYNWKVGIGNNDNNNNNTSISWAGGAGGDKEKGFRRKYAPPDIHVNEGYYTTTLTDVNDSRGFEVGGSRIPRRREFKGRKRRRRGHVNVRFKEGSGDGGGGGAYGWIGGSLGGSIVGISETQRFNGVETPREREGDSMEIAAPYVPWSPMSPVRLKETRDDDIGVALSV